MDQSIDKKPILLIVPDIDRRLRGFNIVLNVIKIVWILIMFVFITNSLMNCRFWVSYVYFNTLFIAFIVTFVTIAGNGRQFKNALIIISSVFQVIIALILFNIQISIYTIGMNQFKPCLQLI